MGEWKCSSTYSQPRHWVEVSEHLYATAAAAASLAGEIYLFPLPGIEPQCVCCTARTLISTLTAL
jgi:hypothetical protein